jgi:hypothetical protein
MKKLLLLLASHVAVGMVGFGAGIYVLPILTAPPSPAVADLVEAADRSLYSGQFRPDLDGSDAFHWGEGSVYIGHDAISLQGRIAPGPDYKLYLSPEFVNSEADFFRLRDEMARVGDVRTFENFIVPVPQSIDPGAFTTIVVWCESFEQFITAARYQ